MQGDNNSSSTSRGAYDSSYDASTSDRVPGPSRSRGPSLDPAVSRATSRSPRAGETPRTPRKNRSHGSTHTYGDRYVPYPHTSNYTRFIPSRDGTDIQAAFQLIPDQLLTPGGRHKRRTDPEIDAQTEEANEAYSQLLSSELFGNEHLGSSSPSSHHVYTTMSPSRGHVYTSQTTSPSRHRTIRGDSLGSLSPKKNLLNFRSPKSGPSTPHRIRDYRMSGSQLSSGRLHEATTWEGDQSPYGPTPSALSQLGSPALSPSSSASGLFSPRDQVDSPIHTAFSTSPVKPESQRLLLGARKSTRQISKVPYKVLDAPDLADDFYLNLVDWSSQDMLSVGLGKCVYLWSAKSSSVTKLCDLQGVQDSITGLSWSNHGQFLAVGSQSGLVQIWDVETQKLLRTMMGHSARVGALTWNNHILTTGSRDRAIYHRDVRVPDHHIKTLLSHRQEVCGLKWNPAQNQLASGGNDNKLLVWDGLHDAPLHKFTEHTAAVKAIAWSPHQQGLLASGGGTADMKIRFWNTQTGSPLSVIDTGSQVCNLAWNKMSNEIVSTHGYSSGHIHNQIQVWRYPSLSQVATLTGHTMRVLYLAMSPSGKSIVTGAGDETLRFWDLNTPTRESVDRVDDHGLQASFTKLR